MDNIIKNHRLICENRQKLELSGVQKVESSTNTQVVCVVNNTQTTIYGKNLHINKLDLQAGILSIDGEIDSIKYQNGKKSLWKRIFK